MAVAETPKWVYKFEEGRANMRDLLGGKGAGVAEMTNAGLPVPPGFTITTEACVIYNENGKQLPEEVWDQTLDALSELQAKTGKKLGDLNNPLIVSVRSGAAFSMPGMMDTVLDVGFNDQTVVGFARQSNERTAQDCYRRLIQLFGRIVMGVDGQLFEDELDTVKQRHGVKQETDLGAEAMKEVVAGFKRIYQEQTERNFPQDPSEQLKLSTLAVFDSWMSDRAIAYRNANKIPHNLGTAVNIQQMVFGNMGEDSGTGVAFTRDPATGENVLTGEFLFNAQGEDVVAGIRTPLTIEQLREANEAVYNQFAKTAILLEKHYQDVQDLEFTVMNGKLYMLQTRVAQRTAQAAVRIAVEMLDENLIDGDEAVMRVLPEHVVQLLLPRFDSEAKEKARNEKRLVTKGIDASPGAAVGKVIFDADRAKEASEAGEKVILVRPETSPDDVHGLIAAQGVLTARGGKTSHAAVVARGMGKPAVVGAEDVKIDLQKREMVINGKVISEGDIISVDGATGEVFVGEIKTVVPDIWENRWFEKLMLAIEQRKRLQVWANADYPRDAEKAKEFGAEGIGLCRTEHMFMEQERLPFVQQMILSAPVNRRLRLKVEELARLRDDNPGSQAVLDQYAEAVSEWHGSADGMAYNEALAKLLEFQRSDFKGILRVMEGLPVVIRLIDPPLHEFLPDHDELLVKTTKAQLSDDKSPDAAERVTLLKAVDALREQNPMLGLRGVRLGLTYPEIIDMQVTAIMEAACELKKDGLDARPEIMIPLVGHVNELTKAKERVLGIAAEVMAKQGVNVEYKFGTMIEVPRAALTADAIAEHAEFFSFGTNDLTQMTFAYSRDDAEAKFLGGYLADKILPTNPFQTIDRDGVGQLVRMAVEAGKRHGLELGVCGEHGGDPDSIAFFDEIGLNYVSTSPYRVLVAKLAAARSAVEASRASKLKN